MDLSEKNWDYFLDQLNVLLEGLINFRIICFKNTQTFWILNRFFHSIIAEGKKRDFEKIVFNMKKVGILLWPTIYYYLFLTYVFSLFRFIKSFCYSVLFY